MALSLYDSLDYEIHLFDEMLRKEGKTRKDTEGGTYIDMLEERMRKIANGGAVIKAPGNGGTKPLNPNETETMKETENKTDEVEILVNTEYGGFSLPAMAKIWLMQLGYTADQARGMVRGDCPRDLPDLVEAFKRYGNGHCSRIEVQTLPRGTAYRIDEYDGLETVVTENDWQVAGAGIADTDFIPPGERVDSPNMARLSREVLGRMDSSTKLEWLQAVHPLLYSKLQSIYEDEVPDGNAQSRWDLEEWAFSDKGRKVLDDVVSETLEGDGES